MLHDIKILRAAMKNEIQATTSSEDTHLKYRDIFNERYYMFNKKLLYAAGLWPYQPFKQKAVRTSVPLIASIIIMAAQVRAMIQAWGQFNLFAECIAPLTMNVAGIIKLTCGLSYTQEMRKLFDGMQKDWEAMRHLPQINILEKYGEQGRLWTICYFTLLYVIVCGWVVMAFSPKIMDALIPLNYSRRRFDLFPTDFMVDPDDYFYPILIFITVTLMYHIIVYVSIDTLYMVLAQHERAMFEILRYNLDNVLEDDESTDIILKPDIYNDMHYRKLIACIKEHKVITEFIKTIESMCEWKLLIIVGLNTVCLSFTGYMVIVTRDDSSIVDTLRFAFFSIAQVFHLFCITLPSHWIMESSSLIPNAAYSSRWYMMSLRSRKLTLFLIRASIEPCNITAGKIYVMSVENFSGVLQTSMSYLTMLNSIQ